MKKKLASTVIACSVAVTQISDIAIFADSAIKENINKEVISSEKNTKKETKILDNSNKSKVVNIKDKYLKKLINETLDRNRPIYGDITVGEMERLTELRKQDSGFQPSSLEGLEYAINLEVINISYSPVSDFSPIQNLSKLREIRFDNNRSNDRKGIIDFD